MPPVYEFKCPKGHTIDTLVPVATLTYPCTVCMATAKSMDDLTLASRVLSPTPTSFHFADTRKRTRNFYKE